MPIVPVSFSLNHISVSISTVMLSGYADGDAVTIEFAGDDFEATQGSDGNVVAIQKHNVVADVTVRLAQGNPSIAVLRQLHAASLQAGGIWYDFKAVNLKSADEVCTGRCMFKKHPPIKWGDSAQPAEFELILAVTTMAGGSIFPI